MNLATKASSNTIDPVRKTVIALNEIDGGQRQPAREELLEALSRDGFCFVESRGSSALLDALLSELSGFFGSASHQEKTYLKAYLWGCLRGYCPPLEPHSQRLERRKERYVFGNKNNLFPGNFPVLECAYNNVYSKHIQCIADVVYTSIYRYLHDIESQWAKNFRNFFLNPHSGEVEPSVLCYAMHYPRVEHSEEFANADQTVTVSEPHVDMTTFTILPRGTRGATKMFDESGKIIPIYDSSIPPDAILVFVGKTLERLLEGIPFKSRNERFPFRAFRHTVKNTIEEVSKDRDVIGFFFNGNSSRPYTTVADAKEFGSMFIDRRPSRMKQREPLSGTRLTVKDRQYLTEQLFFSDESPNSASPPVTLKQFRSVN